MMVQQLGPFNQLGFLKNYAPDQTCDESFITLYTIYFWIVVGPMVALTAFVAWVLCVGAICLRMSMA